jgi:hypothetical protein
VEHYYPVSVGMGALEWGVHTTLQFKVRDLLWEGAAGSSSGRADAPPKPPPEDPPPAY